ncbi:hypothetical protein LSAT2_028043 [Lamellibrachia satsuma]|nr:hypothetical protein LSAT2_028043 [Lamellibrachia satsuma]
MSSEGLPGRLAQCQRHRRLPQRGLESDSAHCPQHGQQQSAVASTRGHPAGRPQHQTQFCGPAPPVCPGHVTGRHSEDRPHPETPWPHQRAPSGSRGGHG